MFWDAAESLHMCLLEFGSSHLLEFLLFAFVRMSFYICLHLLE